MILQQALLAGEAGVPHPATNSWRDIGASGDELPPARVLYRGVQLSKSRMGIVDAWLHQSGKVLVAQDFWKFEGSAYPGDLVLGKHSFCEVLAERIGLRLVSPANRWLNELPNQWLKRDIGITRAAELNGPSFVKPMDHQAFSAGIYTGLDEVVASSWGPVAGDMEVLVSEIVDIEAEARSFVAGQEIYDLCLYRGSRPLDEARDFLAGFLIDNCFSMPCVVDLLYIRGRGWAILEFNPCWASEIFSCDSGLALACIRRSVLMDSDVAVWRQEGAG